MEETRALFRDAEATQFVIVTIPTAMAAAESARLAKALLQQQVGKLDGELSRASMYLTSQSACWHLPASGARLGHQCCPPP